MKIIDKQLIVKAIDEFFFEVVRTSRSWKVAELKYEGWNRATPNLIKLLKELEKNAK